MDIDRKNVASSVLYKNKTAVKIITLLMNLNEYAYLIVYLKNRDMINKFSGFIINSSTPLYLWAIFKEERYDLKEDGAK